MIKVKLVVNRENNKQIILNQLLDSAATIKDGKKINKNKELKILRNPPPP